MVSAAANPWWLAQQFPCNAGARLLSAGGMDALQAADQLDRLRLGIGHGRHLNNRNCILCGSSPAGLAHILAECTVLRPARQVFLA